MLKKQSRDIRFLGIECVYQSYGRKEPILRRPSLAIALEKLADQIQSNGVLKEPYLKNRLCVGLRRIVFSEDHSTATLLWAGGDSDAVDPCFWDADSDAARTEEAQSGERVAVSCHMVISLTETPSNKYIAVKEEVPILSNGLLQRFFNHLLKEYAYDSLQDPDKKEKPFKAYPSVSLDTLASKTIAEALTGKIPFMVEAVSVTKGQKRQDENFSVDRETKKLALKPVNGWELPVFIKNLTALLPTIKTYDEVYIRYKDAKKKQSSLNFEMKELEGCDLETCLFAQRLTLSLNASIGQFSDDVHSELEKKMRENVILEHNKLVKKFNESS